MISSPTPQQQPLSLTITPALQSPSASLSTSSAPVHHNSCTCKICAKQQQVKTYKKYKDNFPLYLQTIYQNDFMHKNQHKNDRKKKKQYERNQSMMDRKIERSLDQRRNMVDYVDLQSTYGKQYVNKRVQIKKMRPEDNLGGLPSYIPSSTTYMRSYNSTLTPRPDQPFKRIQMPVNNDLIFKSESVYQKSYKNEHQIRPNLPFIRRQALSKPKSIGTFESTQKKSYSSSTINPQSIMNQPIKPTGNIRNLISFAHNYDTTYRNFFVPSAKKFQDPKCGIDQIGNVYRRNHIYRI